MPRHLRLGVVLALAALPFLPASCGDGIDVTLGNNIANSPDDSGSDVSSEGGQIDTNPADGSESGPDSSPEAGCPGGEQPPVGGLLGEREGFGANASGGADGCVYHVTTDADSLDEGTLRAGLESDQARWIVFDQDFTIELKSNLIARSNKTIDGRGKNVTLENYGITIDNQPNIIIESVSFVGTLDCELDDSCTDEFDAIALQGSATRDIWIDHCSFTHYHDGLVDIVAGATDVTISWSRFFVHEHAMLFGSEDDSPDALKQMRVTLHHNLFQETESFNPRIRHGYVHMFNNFLLSWRSYGAGASLESRLFSEWNVYLADSDQTAISNSIEQEAPGNVRTENDKMLNDAEAELTPENDAGAVVDPDTLTPGYKYVAETHGDASGLQLDINNLAGPRQTTD